MTLNIINTVFFLLTEHGGEAKHQPFFHLYQAMLGKDGKRDAEVANDVSFRIDCLNYLKLELPQEKTTYTAIFQ